MRTTIRMRGAAAALSLLTIAASAAIATAPAPADARATTSAESPEPSDRWLKGLTGKYRQLFDAPAAGGGIPLVHVMNYYDTYNRHYRVTDDAIDGVLTFYGATTFHALNDAMWAKYRIGDFLAAIDPSISKTAVANPWRATPVILGQEMPAASIEALQKRGATFIVCNNALGIFAGMLAKARGLEPAAVYADMKANILPGVELVPAMVIAIEQAQKAGVSYHRQ